MTTVLAELHASDVRTNGHQPIILPVWASRDAVAEPTDRLTEPTVQPAPEPPVDQAVDVGRLHGAAVLKAVAPLVVVNSLAVYGQLAYALEHIAPTDWVIGARIALSIGFAAAVESVALYVGWHAHDALLLKSHATARNLRRWSFTIAAAVAAMNYAHFAAPGMRPTAAASAFGLLSLLSPWMWGLHSRRAARLQLLKERKVDEAGAEFSSERRRAFPIRTWQARRWSIDHGVTDPLEAWRGYNADRTDRLANRPTDRQDVRSGGAASTDRPTDRPADRLSPATPTVPPTDCPTVEPTETPTARPTVALPDRPTVDRRANRLRRRLSDRPFRSVARRAVPTDRPTETPTETPADQPDRKPAPKRRPSVRGAGKHSAAAVVNAAALRKQYGDRLTLSAYVMRKELGWSHARMVAAVAAHKAKADLSVAENGGTR